MVAPSYSDCDRDPASPRTTLRSTLYGVLVASFFFLPFSTRAGSTESGWLFDSDLTDSRDGGGNDLVQVAGSATYDTLVPSITGAVYGSNRSYIFDGTTDRLEVADTASLNTRDTSFTIMYWMRRDSGVDREQVMEKRDAGETVTWEFSAGGAAQARRMRFLIRDTSGTLEELWSTTQINASTWVHVVGVVDRDADEARLYINGALEDSTNISALGDLDDPVGGGGNTLRISSSAQLRNNFAEPYDGRLDEIGFFRSAVTQSNIQFLAENTLKDYVIPTPPLDLTLTLPADGDNWTESGGDVTWSQTYDIPPKNFGSVVWDPVNKVLGAESLKVSQTVLDDNFGAMMFPNPPLTTNIFDTLRLWVKADAGTTQIQVDLLTFQNFAGIEINIPLAGPFDWTELIIPLTNLVDGATFPVGGVTATVNEVGTANLQNIKVLFISNVGAGNRCMWVDGLALEFELAQSPKKIVGGHGFSMVTTWLLRQHIEEMRAAPLSGILVHVNRNDWASNPVLREERFPARWFTSPAVTISDFSVALGDLAATDMGHFQNNILWTGGTRSFGGDWFDESFWTNVAIPNALALAQVYVQGGFKAVWFDNEIGGVPPDPNGGWLTWKGKPREFEHPFPETVDKVRQRGRELMEAFTSVKPDFKLILAFSYGFAEDRLKGAPGSFLSEVEYGLAPAFVDGLLEGCGESGLVIESGESTYGTMTYVGYNAWRSFDQLSAEKLCSVPGLLSNHYGHACGMWPDFENRGTGWDPVDLENNHFSPDRMKHALHNAMASSDEFVWTWSWMTHWWPNRTPNPPAPVEYVFGDPYAQSILGAYGLLDLNWNPGDTSEAGYASPSFTPPTLDSKYVESTDLSGNWLFQPADSLNPKALNWGAQLYAFGPILTQSYPYMPISTDDYWENQGIQFNGIGAYRTLFEIPPHTQNRRYQVMISGVSDRSDLYLAQADGTSAVKSVIGFAREGGDPWIMDITDQMDRAGTNSITLLVDSPSGAGGLYGSTRLLTTHKGPDGYAELRGKQTGEWYHWLKDSNRTPSTPLVLNRVNTLEARIRIPDVPGSQYAELAMTTQDGGWSLRFTPTNLDFNGLNLNFNTIAWLTYRITIEWNVDHYDKKLYVNGIHLGTTTAAPMSPANRGSAVIFGVGWGNPSLPPIVMDVDYIRWENSPVAPPTNPAWDEAYEGDRTPDSEGWLWWDPRDPRPFTAIVEIDPNAFNLWLTVNGLAGASLYDDSDGDGLDNGGEYNLGSNPNFADVDEDSFGDPEEQIAGTNPNSGSDFFSADDFILVGPGQSADVPVNGKAGRVYRLLRTTDPLIGPLNWTAVATAGPLASDMALVLSDPSPLTAKTAVYAVEVSYP
jgi:hypothetical protein